MSARIGSPSFQRMGLLLAALCLVAPSNLRAQVVAGPSAYLAPNAEDLLAGIIELSEPDGEPVGLLAFIVAFDGEVDIEGGDRIYHQESAFIPIDGPLRMFSGAIPHSGFETDGTRSRLRMTLAGLGEADLTFRPIGPLRPIQVHCVSSVRFPQSWLLRAILRNSRLVWGSGVVGSLSASSEGWPARVASNGAGALLTNASAVSAC